MARSSKYVLHKKPAGRTLKSRDEPMYAKQFARKRLPRATKKSQTVWVVNHKHSKSKYCYKTGTKSGKRIWKYCGLVSNVRKSKRKSRRSSKKRSTKSRRKTGRKSRRRTRKRSTKRRRKSSRKGSTKRSRKSGRKSRRHTRKRSSKSRRKSRRNKKQNGGGMDVEKHRVLHKMFADCVWWGGNMSRKEAQHLLSFDDSVSHLVRISQSKPKNLAIDYKYSSKPILVQVEWENNKPKKFKIHGGRTWYNSLEDLLKGSGRGKIFTTSCKDTGWLFGNMKKFAPPGI